MTAGYHWRYLGPALVATTFVSVWGCAADCSPDSPVCDNPDPIAPSVYRAWQWTITDESSGEVLSDGCDWQSASVHAEIGQYLVVTVRIQGVEKTGERHHDFSSNAAYACSTEDDVSRYPWWYVTDFACYEFPDDAALRVARIEITPSRNDSHRPSDTVSGSGFQMWLEVVGYGTLRWIDTGQCETADGWGPEVLPPEE